MIGHVINLARAPERWASMARIAAERGLALERIEAVDGRDPAALAANAAAPDCGLAPAEIGCFESHRAAWARIATGGAPFGLVLEDDVFLGDVGLLDALAEGAEWLDLLKLNAHPRGMLVHAAPLALVGGRALLRPAQRTSDASAYLISRAFAARALEMHRGYREPLDVALFDPATGAAVAQLDPALTIQQRYADFRFLDEGARKTHIQAPRPRRRQGPVEAAGRELERVWRRRIVPAAQPALNLLRPPADRLAFRRIAFDG
ncbi:MAG TPA: glycosyltransferase family 25 protein [Amaricoccus sp.]|nr:glycosyltransferase family 25 protein [Amaricoccus sp.]